MPMVEVEVEENQIVVDEWIGCYSGGWKGVICGGAFAHPAKVAFNLARRIYEHAIDEGWIVAGDTCVDPFGGIGGCAFHGLINGMRVVTCELEGKFVDLSKENRELWRAKFTGLPGFDADNWTILQGDSRRLASVIRDAGIAVSSPPYATDQMGGGGNKHDRNLDGMKAGYGQAEGQLGAMREGDLTLAVSSPPYASVALNPGDTSRPEAKIERLKREGKHREAEVVRQHGSGKASNLRQQDYGTTEGQLGAMPEGKLCVSSPPFPQPYSPTHFL